MKFDIIDVAKDACETLFGRVFLVLLVVHVSGSFGFSVGPGNLSDFFGSLLGILPALIFTLIGGIGLITLPMLFGFTICYVRFELSHYFLIIPAVLAFITFYKL